MADIQKTTSTLYMGFEKADGKTQLVKLPNPSRSINATDAKDAMNYIVSNGILLDNDNQSFTGVVTAYTEDSTKTSLDLD